MAYLEARQLSNIQILDDYSGSILSDDFQELRNATAAFLSDRYYDGTYVATPDDIEDLQNATALFLGGFANRTAIYDGNTCTGLLLPGEPFLLPIPLAVAHARSTDGAVANSVSPSDKSFDDTVVRGLKVTEPQHSRPTGVLQTMELRRERQRPREHADVSHDDLLDEPGKPNKVLNTIEDADGHHSVEIIDTTLEDADLAFDAREVQSRSQASNAASFLDPELGALVSHTCSDQGLIMDDGYMQLAHVQRVSGHNVERQADEHEDEHGNYIDLRELADHNHDPNPLKVGSYRAICSRSPLLTTADFNKHGQPKITANPPATWMHEPCSAASSCSVEFVGHEEVLKFPELGPETLLENEEMSLLGRKSAGDLDAIFDDDVWTNTPDLDLVLPANQLMTKDLVGSIRAS